MNVKNKPERRAQWQLLVEEQEKSGLSQNDFCKARDLVLSQFVYYRSTLKAKKRDQATTASLFSPIHIKKTEQNMSVEIKIILPNGFQCIVSSQIEGSHLKSMLEVLLSC